MASQNCITDLDQEHLLTFTGVRRFPSIWATFVKSTVKNKRTECPREPEQNRLPGFQAMVSLLWVLGQRCWVGRFSSAPTERTATNGAPRWLWLLLHHSYAAKTGSVACCGSEVFWKEENYRNEAENQPGSTLKTSAVQVLKETQQLSRLAALSYDWDLKENTRTSSKWSPQFLVSTSSWRKHLAPSVKLLSPIIKHSWSNTANVVFQRREDWLKFISSTLKQKWNQLSDPSVCFCWWQVESVIRTMIGTHSLLTGAGCKQLCPACLSVTVW